jgi:transcriptional regulator with XRE-family HTH domain
LVVSQRRRGTEAVQNFDPDALRDARVKRRWTHDAFVDAFVAAHGSGVSRPILIAYEKGRRRPSPERLVQLAAVLGVEPLSLTRATPASTTLADLRVSVGMSMSTIAPRLNLSRSEYQDLELGVTPMQPDVEAELVRQLNVPVRRLRQAYRRGAAQAGAKGDGGQL